MKFTFFLIFLVLLVSCRDKKKSIQSVESIDSLAYKVELGKKLFFDKQLSVTGQVSCASCHLPEFAFSDTVSKSRGVFDRSTKRNAPSLLNMESQPHFMWEGGVKTLAMQALVPLKDTNEMGSSIKELVAKLSKDKTYNEYAEKAFGRTFDAFVLTQALEAFQKSLVSRNSPFDRWYLKNEDVSFSASAERGFNLFTSKKMNCISCHQLPDFTDYSFANKGLYTVYKDLGRSRITHSNEDEGKFKVPSLRNVTLTAPYMHDGSIKTLREVVLHYSSGGSDHPNKDSRIQPFAINETEMEDLITFFETLTDTSYRIRFR